MFDLTGKRALVTGSTQGIGFAIAECLAKQGADVFVHGSTSVEKCEKAAQRIREGGAKVKGIAVADLSKPDGAEKLFEAVGGEIDILVLNASIQFRKKWNEITPEEMEIQLQTNFKSSLRLIQLCEPHMEAKCWGRVVTIGSVQQYKPHKDMAVYASSKAAQMNLVTNLAKQLAPLGITVRKTEEDNPLPFADNSFDLVLNRHDSYDVNEVRRVLKPGGYFITQQVGGSNDLRLRALLGNNKTEIPDFNLENELPRFKNAGFTVNFCDQAYVTDRYFDVGAFVWYAKVLPWEFGNFTVESCLPQLNQLDALCEKQGYIPSVQHRFILIVRNRKPKA